MSLSALVELPLVAKIAALPWAALFLLMGLVRLRVYLRWHVSNRRKMLDRRTQQVPFDGPERRSGLDRRRLVPAL
jgi:hypothetical protein